MKPFLRNLPIKSNFFGFPLASLTLGLLSFGLLIPWLGLYWDDWPITGAARLQGTSLPLLWKFYEGERPFSAWTYFITLPVLGTHPLVWHIFTLTMRWLTVMGFWWILRLLWPANKRQIEWMGLLFMIYPVFGQQPVAVAFSQHWMTYGLFTISIAAMLQAVRTPGYFWIFTILAVFAQVFHTQTMEYFWGLDLLRPLLLWVILRETNPDILTKLKKILKIWLPYIFVLVAAVIMRFFLFVSPSEDIHRPELAFDLISNPIITGLRLAQIATQDLIYNLFGIWIETFLPKDVILSNPIVPASLLLALVVAFVFYAILKKRVQGDEPPMRQTDWIKQAFLIGIVAALLGPLPAWLTERQVIYGMYSGRFALAGMFGFSILVVVLLEWLSNNFVPKLIVVCVLLGLAAGYHLRNADTYLQSTHKQNQFYWQLFWRAPYIEPGTAILSADELFIYVGRDPTSVAMNLLYPQQKGITDVGYWFLELYYNIGEKRVSELSKGITYDMDFRSFHFTGSSLDSLLVYYKGDSGRCMWLLSADDTDNPNIPELADRVLSVSDLSRIKQLPIAEDYPPPDLFGEEPDHTWCYFFQKADLARQFGEWETVAQLGDLADQEGYSPNDANEWIPFIQGYARAGRWQEAAARTNLAVAQDEKVFPRICRIWENILAEAHPPPENLDRIMDGLSESGCAYP